MTQKGHTTYSRSELDAAVAEATADASQEIMRMRIECAGLALECNLLRDVATAALWVDDLLQKKSGEFGGISFVPKPNFHLAAATLRRATERYQENKDSRDRNLKGD